MTVEEVQEYLKVDSDYDIDFISELIEVSQIYIDSCVGDAYKDDEKAVKLSKLLQRKLIADMYDERATEVPGTTKRDKIVQSILDKLSNYI